MHSRTTYSPFPHGQGSTSIGYLSTALIGVPLPWSAESSLELVSNAVPYSFVRSGIGHRLILLRRCDGRVRAALIRVCLAFSAERSRERVGESVGRFVFGRGIRPRGLLLGTSGPLAIRQ